MHAGFLGAVQPAEGLTYRVWEEKFLKKTRKEGKKRRRKGKEGESWKTLIIGWNMKQGATWHAYVKNRFQILVFMISTFLLSKPYLQNWYLSLLERAWKDVTRGINIDKCLFIKLKSYEAFGQSAADLSPATNENIC